MSTDSEQHTHYIRLIFFKELHVYDLEKKEPG